MQEVLIVRLLSPELLVHAYSQGIFPMGDEGEIQWFSPDPRAIIPIETFRASKTLMQTVRSGRFDIRVSTRFREVMEACAQRSEGTWITAEIVDAYCSLHELGLAHSVESWLNGELVGGLYGVTLRGAFFGESMFFRVRDASKVALVALVQRMKDRKFTLLDTQWITPHLASFGAFEISRDEYMSRLSEALEADCSFVDDDD